MGRNETRASADDGAAPRAQRHKLQYLLIQQSDALLQFAAMNIGSDY